MSDIPDIINAQIISSDYDIFWTLPEEVTTLAPRPVLIASQPFDRGSAEETQLKKMLQACQLNEQDYHIILFTEGKYLAWHLLRDQLQVKAVILLGISPAQLGVSALFMPHQLSRFNQCNWILTESLQVLMTRPEIKNHLWQYGLKPAFVEKVYD